MNTITKWANDRVETITAEIEGLIDCGMEMESAVDLAFENSVLGDGCKTQVLTRVAGYHHEHRFVTDAITGKKWCATCQKFQ